MAIDKIEAILKLDSNARVRIIGNELTWLDDNPNNITNEQINNKIIELEQEAETAKQVKETAQATGNQKLLDLGLTQAEATALTGYTPPVAE